MKTRFKMIWSLLLFFLGFFLNSPAATNCCGAPILDSSVSETLKTNSNILWNTLTASQQEALDSGKQILITEEVPKAIWPRFYIYRLVPASPSEVESVFWDVNDDVNYIPYCTKVTVHRRLAPNIVEAIYHINVPFLPQEISQVRTEVNLLPHGIYSNTWTILSSRYSQSGSGSFLVVPHHNGSLICYMNFVVPKSSIASILRGQAENQIKMTVSAIAKRVEYQMKKDPQHHGEQLKQLSAALTRIFHTDLLRKPGSPTQESLSSKSSSGSVDSHSRRQTSSIALPHQASQLPRHDQYEISGLKRNSQSSGDHE